MKKQILFIVMMLLPIIGRADAVEIDGIYYNLIQKGSVAEVTNNPKSYKGNIVIPASIKYEGETYTVTNIGKYAFRDCEEMASVTIPSTVVAIGEDAFRTSLTSVHISDLDAWCKIAFYNNFSNPLYCGQHLFLNGVENNHLLIPNSVTSIGDYAFCGCISFESVTIPNSVTSIGAYAFDYCSNLTSVTIPNSVTSIGANAFYQCSNLTSVTIPNSVTDIGVGTFYRCSRLESAMIGSSVKNIGDAAFSYCNNLTSIIIPDSVTSIGNFAFSGCTNLKSVKIGNSVNRIGWRAFSSCSKLSDVSLGKGIVTIYMYAFENCTDLTNVYCYAENVPYMIDNKNKPCTNAFEGSYIEYATLHVPDSSIEVYKSKEPWNNFKDITKIMPLNTITYLCDGVVYKTYQLEEGTTITPEPFPTKEGYTFNGWSEIPETMPAHDVTVTGTFTINKYKLAYIVDGEEYKSYEVEYGATITPEAAPTKEGYTFSGWSEIPETMPAHDVTVTGTFTLTYPNGQCETPTISYANGKLKFECKTEGVEYVSTISDEDIKTHTSDEVILTATYLISVYAKAEGYKNSNVATATLCWIDAEPFAEGTKEAEDNVTEVKAMPVLIQANAGVLNISGAPEGANISVYDTSGRMLGSSIAINGTSKIKMSLRARTVIVKIGDKAVKVKIK